MSAPGSVARAAARVGAALVVSVAAASAGSAIPAPRAAHAAAPYSVGTNVARGYSGAAVGLNNYTTRNLGAYAAVGSAGEPLPVWCIQAHLNHSTAASGYALASSNIVDSGALDYLLWRYRSFDLLDAAGESHDRAAAINGLTLFYGRSPRNGNSLLVWSNSLTGAAITPANSAGHRWSALPQFSLSFPIGMYDLGNRNFDRAEALTDELFHEAERLAAPWSLTNVADDTVRLTAAGGAPISGHPVELLGPTGELIATAMTGADGELRVTDARVSSVRSDAPGAHFELSAGSSAQRLIGGGSPVSLVTAVSVSWEPTVSTQVSEQSAMPFTTVTDSLHIDGVPDGRSIDVELELYDLDADPDGGGVPLTAALITGLGNGWSHGHAPYTVRPEQQGARLSYRERWVDPTTGERGPWSELGVTSETVTIGRFELTSATQTPYAAAGAAVVDRVSYPAGLDPDAGQWALRGVVAGLDGTEVTSAATTTFTPDPAGGYADVTVSTDGLAAGRYVVFQDLLLDGAPIASHRDADDAAQQFVVVELATAVHEQRLGPGSHHVTDRVAYTSGLDPAAGTWTLRGVVVDRTRGTATSSAAEVEFAPETDGGVIDVTLPAPPAGDYVVFEYLLLDDRPIAMHTDLTAEAQWFTVVEPEPTWTRPPTTSEPVTSAPTTTPTPAVPPGGPSGGGLPSTGSDTTSMLMTAAGLTGIGATLWLLVHQEREIRRRSTPEA